MIKRGKKFWGIFALVAPVASMIAMLIVSLLFRMFAILLDNELVFLIDHAFSVFVRIFFVWAIFALLIGVPVGIVLLASAKKEKSLEEKNSVQ